MPGYVFRSSLLGPALLLFLPLTPLPGQPTRPPTTRPSSQPPSASESGSAVQFNGKTLREWIQQMAHSDPSKRTQAIIAVTQFGESSTEAVPALLSRLRDSDVSPRIKAVMALRMVSVHDRDIARVVQELGRLVSYESESQTGVRYEAALTLQRFVQDAAPAIPGLIRGTTDNASWEIRYNCLLVLWRAGLSSKSGPDERVTQALLNCVHREREASQVKLEALCGLGGMGRPSNPMMLARVISTLEAGSTSSNKVYAVWAYAGLVAMSDKASEQSLRALARFLTPSHSLEVRSQAAQALGALGDRAKSRIPDLIALLDDKEALAVHGACVALTQIGDNSSRVLDALIPLLDKDPDRAFAACSALVQLGHLNEKVIIALEKQAGRSDKDSDKLKPMFRSALAEVKKPKK